MSDISQTRALHVVLGVQPATLRKWLQRGHIRRADDGTIDLASLVEHAEKRAVVASA